MNQYEKFIDWLKRHPYKKTITYHSTQRIGRNEKCPCGSGLKFKHCCWKKHIDNLAKKALDESPEFIKHREKEAKYFNNKYRRITND